MAVKALFFWVRVVVLGLKRFLITEPPFFHESTGEGGLAGVLTPVRLPITIL